MVKSRRMENMNNTPNKSKAPMLILSGIVIAVIIALAVWQLSAQDSNEAGTMEETETMRESDDAMMEDDSMMEEDDDEMVEEEDEEEEDEPVDETAYEDGTYNATGEYSSPAGDEEVLVTLTLENDVVVDVAFEGLASHPTSVKLQDMFAEEYEEEVVGKSIDEINLTVVNGSSLTPVGFMDALADIRAEAKS